MAMMMNHLRRVAAHCDKNKMTINNLAICFGPVLLCPAPSSSSDPAVDFSKHIDVLRYLLEIWECDNGTGEFMKQVFIRMPRYCDGSVTTAQVSSWNRCL
jgi:hypothetical protein